MSSDGAGSLLRDLAARPRPVGSEALSQARERCAHELRSLGFEVRERPFTFSGFPGRAGTPLIGGLAAMLVGWAGKLGVLHERWLPLGVMAGGVVALILAARWLAVRGVLDAPLLRERGVTLEAARGTPRVWLCAHLDSKSQPLPTLVRSAGLVVEGIGVFVALAVAVAVAGGAFVGPIWWVIAAVLTLVGAVPVVLSWVGSSSPGAFDNASGVVTVIEAARLLADVEVGVLLTDAEELGLAGARAWTREGAGHEETVLNCDGVDDSGGIAIMYSGRRPERVLGAVSRASRATSIPHESMRMLPGILTDSVAFAHGGMESVTFSKGTLGSLLRVHGRRDNLDHLRGTGIAQAAMLIAATARDIAGDTT